jgi:glycosyltransferase involved in cell wall biosynthesis
MRIAIVSDIDFLYEDTMYLNELEKRLRSNGIDCNVFNINGAKILKRIDSATGLVRILNASKLKAQLLDYDIIHAQFSYPIGFALTLLSSLKLLEKPIIIHTHGYDVFTVPSINYGIRRNQIGRYLTEYAWKRAERIIAVCKKSEDELRNAMTRTNIDLLYNGVNELLFTKNTSELPKEISMIRDEADFIFLSIASLVPVKNHQRLIKAFSDLVKRDTSRSKIKMILIGSQPEYYSVNHSGHGNIIYLGKKPHRDLASYYSIADAFVLPSLSEAHPWSMLEAMSCQLPVIASAVGGIPETLEDSNFIVDPYDQNDIMAKLDQLIEMSMTERKEIGIENRQRILKRFTLDLHTEKLMRIYHQALTSS